MSDITEKNLVSIDDVFNSLPEGQIFLKMDIEGSEYRILDSIAKNSDRIIGMAIEFHDCDLHLERLNDFLTKIPHQIIHIHANNFGRLSKNLIPHALEISLSRSARQLEVSLLPHPLDMPNYPPRPDIELVFDDTI